MNWLRKWPPRARTVRGWRPEGSSRKVSGMVLAPRGPKPAANKKTLPQWPGFLMGAPTFLAVGFTWPQAGRLKSPRMPSGYSRATPLSSPIARAAGAAGSLASMGLRAPEMLAPRPLAQPRDGDAQRRRPAHETRQQQRELGAALARLIEQCTGLGDQHIDRERLRQIGAADAVEPLARRRLAGDDQHRHATV